MTVVREIYAIGGELAGKPELIARFVAWASDDDINVRIAAIRHLGWHLGEQDDIVEKLMCWSKADEPERVRCEAIQALSKASAGSDKVYRFLMSIVDSGRIDDVHAAAVVSLAGPYGDDARIRGYLIDHARQASPFGPKETAFRLLGELFQNDAQARELIIREAGSNRWKEIRQEAMIILGKKAGHDRRAKACLIEAVEKDDDGDVREEALEGLSDLIERDGDILAHVIKWAAHHDDDQIRYTSIDYLGGMATSDPEIRKLIGERAQRDPSPYVRSAALRALGEATKP